MFRLFLKLDWPPTWLMLRHTYRPCSAAFKQNRFKRASNCFLKSLHSPITSMTSSHIAAFSRALAVPRCSAEAYTAMLRLVLMPPDSETNPLQI